MPAFCLSFMSLLSLIPLFCDVRSFFFVSSLFCLVHGFKVKSQLWRWSPGAECRWRDHWENQVLTDLTLSLFFSFFAYRFPLVFLALLLCQGPYDTIFLCLTSCVPLSSHLQGERCSFSVQMWYYFLCGLRSDLWPVLPAVLSKEVLGNVLAETLQLLVQRYALAQPSYKRHLQIRYSSLTLNMDRAIPNTTVYFANKQTNKKSCSSLFWQIMNQK